jgi:hypothetical protein
MRGSPDTPLPYPRRLPDLVIKDKDNLETKRRDEGFFSGINNYDVTPAPGP